MDGRQIVYQLIYLSGSGYEIVRSKISVREFLEQKQQREAQHYGTIHINGGNAIIGSNNSGVVQAQDGTMVNTGNKARIDSHTAVEQGSFGTLAKKLSDSYVSQQDLEELMSILESETPNKEKATFGDKTNGWITKMVSKSLDGTRQIGIGTAGGVLLEAIKTFYGWQ